MKLLDQARKLPPGMLLRKTAGHWARRVRTWAVARTDARRGTFLQGERAFVPLPFERVHPTAEEAPLLLALAARYAAHEFDLLGSGWKRVPAPPVGTEALPEGCRVEAMRIREMIAAPYEPIDWHLDFKSGHRWSESLWHANVPYGHLPGVDVKVPWELARLQHAPVLALAARVANPEEAQRWRTEAVNQMLDFVAANPPRFGVNWRTAMDVGIRAANIALTVDLLLQDRIDGPWVGLLARSVEEHALHIRANLEWSPHARGNHYLANIAGVAWCASHLEASDEAREWASWATKELEVETSRQFHQDGSNFEASVCYHRLSAEIVAWTLACLSARARPIPGLELQRVRTRLPAMASFTQWATKPGGAVVQIGDNDSGRFFKLPGEFDGTQEQPLHHREMLDVLSALGGGSAKTLAGRIAGALASFEGRLPEASPMKSFGLGDAPGRVTEEVSVELDFGEGCWDGLETAAFPDFGLYLWRSHRVWMAVRCGTVGQGGIGGHAHNDALHLELSVDGSAWIADPGTGVYTPDPAVRNRYRSATAHYVPAVGGREPASLSQGLFRLPDCGARCHRFGVEGFEGSHEGFGPRIWRTLELTPRGLKIRDVWEGGRPSPIVPVSADKPWRPIAFSPGYGRFEE